MASAQGRRTVGSGPGCGSPGKGAPNSRTLLSLWATSPGTGPGSTKAGWTQGHSSRSLGQEATMPGASRAPGCTRDFSGTQRCRCHTSEGAGTCTLLTSDSSAPHSCHPLRVALCPEHPMSLLCLYPSGGEELPTGTCDLILICN